MFIFDYDNDYGNINSFKNVIELLIWILILVVIMCVGLGKMIGWMMILLYFY